MDAWVSVTDRLPDMLVSVLVWHRNGYATIAWWDDTHQGWDHDNWHGVQPCEVVTHWRELPAPPDAVPAQQEVRA